MKTKTDARENLGGKTPGLPELGGRCSDGPGEQAHGNDPEKLRALSGTQYGKRGKKKVATGKGKSSSRKRRRAKTLKGGIGCWDVRKEKRAKWRGGNPLMGGEKEGGCGGKKLWKNFETRVQPPKKEKRTGFEESLLHQIKDEEYWLSRGIAKQRKRTSLQRFVGEKKKIQRD